MLRQAGQFEQALEFLRRAVAADPAQAAYHANLGEAYRGLKQYFEGIDCYLEAARLAPDEFVVQTNLATLYSEAGLHDEAIASYQLAMPLRPGDATATRGIANEYRRQGKLAEAATWYQKAIDADPESAEDLCDLAGVLQQLGHDAEALAALATAVERRPGYAVGHCNLGAAFYERGEIAKAHQHFERAVELEPARAGFHYNLATVRISQGGLDEAIASLDKALELQADYPEARCARGTALLAKGDFKAGWDEYEHRLRCPTNDVPNLGRPLWDGSPLDGRTLLIHGEQALGDTLQFVRYARLAAERGGKVVVAVRRPLVRLLAQSGYEAVSSEDPLPPFDVFAPLLSLPRIFGTQLDTVPRDVPYLAAEPALVATWRAGLQEYPARKVGIAWQGGKKYRGDCIRSIPLAAFAPLAAVSGVQLFSLQKGPGSEQLKGDASHFEVVDLGSSLDNDGAAFVDTAAVIKNLDLVISSDTSIAHLAGALAAPVWVAMSAAPDWRWMQTRGDSPWYPTMQLFRQSTLGDWPQVFDRMASELPTFLAAAPEA